MATDASEQTTASLLREAAEKLGAMSTNQTPAATHLVFCAVEAEKGAFDLIERSALIIQNALNKTNISPQELDQAKEESNKLITKARLAHELSSTLLDSPHVTNGVQETRIFTRDVADTDVEVLQEIVGGFTDMNAAVRDSIEDGTHVLARQVQIATAQALDKALKLRAEQIEAQDQGTKIQENTC
ncbi:unnamed protein product [Zymoseptoria tritici ST99CH_3D7]|uniref:Uncharacterized protein n=1 Tax=Zymoseptoria tritici (strain ST99CH_3D7) TaxID=1276538 RepID=A0A1X7RTR7_ZYMT9|nr:unnamed protein product [Zymoseptoria tritici ST99CH_3D7]